jgi:DNA polymerase-3 subunit epsilon
MQGVFKRFYIVREIVLDTETTGLRPEEGHRVVEIGAVEMVNKVVTGSTFHVYVNPERDMPSDAYRIHGISGEFLRNKPLFGSIADDFLEFISDSVLVIHNAPFDLKFINHELAIIDKPSMSASRAIDTLAYAKKLLPGMKVNLDALCKRYKVDNSDRKFHGALKDALLLADVYVELTGGRQSKFKISNAKESSSLHNVGSKKICSESTPVRLPTQSEILEHQEFLAKFLNGSPKRW